MMLPQNKSEFDKLNITYWWSKGFTGKGVNLVVLDVTGKPFEKDNIINPLQHLETHDKDYGHKSHVCGVVREILPDATIYAMRFNSAYQDECIDWILENKEIIDVLEASDQYNLRALSEPVYKYFICYPKSIHKVG